MGVYEMLSYKPTATTTYKIREYNKNKLDKTELKKNILNLFKKILENGRISNVILSSNSNNHI
jgi:hypothetical protein